MNFSILERKEGRKQRKNKEEKKERSKGLLISIYSLFLDILSHLQYFYPSYLTQGMKLDKVCAYNLLELENNAIYVINMFICNISTPHKTITELKILWWDLRWR